MRRGREKRERYAIRAMYWILIALGIGCLLAVALIGCGGEQHAECRRCGAGPASLMLIGDSNTYLMPDDIAGEAYINCGIPGATTGEIDAKAGRWVETFRPERAVLMIGTNDALLRGESPENYQRAFAALVCRLTGMGVVVSVRDILPSTGAHADINPLTLRYSDMVRAVAERYGLPFLPTRTRFADEAGELAREYARDALHLNAAGFAVLKEHFYD